MLLVKSKYINFKYLINTLLCLLPISFIAGNLIINLNVVLIIISSLFYFQLKYLNLNLFFFEKILIIFFCFSFFVSAFNYVFESAPSNENNFIKSIVFFRYLLLYFTIRILIDEKILNFKLFFLVSSLCVIFVCFDLILQFVTGKDIFGYTSASYKLSGPFGEEKIAGSYLQRFSIFLFFFLPYYFKPNNKNFLVIALSIIFILIFFSLVIAGNRMPMILFLIMFVMLFILEKNLRKFSIIFALFSIGLFLIIFNFNLQVQEYTKYFFRLVFEILTFLNEVIFKNEKPIITNMYIKEFYSGYITWKENLIIGGGINSFYLNCSKNYEFCASHPHNYYIEILSELGIVGFILISYIFAKIFALPLFNRKELSMNFISNLIFPFFLLFFVEIFPIKTSGSFFTTGNSTFIFFTMAIIVGLSRKHQID